jgi:hypothetical protein
MSGTVQRLGPAGVLGFPVQRSITRRVERTQARIFISGGYNLSGTVTDTVELYDPSGSDSSQSLASMSRARASHSSILLDNGKILIVGESDESNELHDELELYDPEANGGKGSPLTSWRNLLSRGLDQAYRSFKMEAFGSMVVWIQLVVRTRQLGYLSSLA